MSTLFSFKHLQVWQKAHYFVIQTYKVTKRFPEDERYGLTSQFRRAAISIAANIAEGYKRIGKQEKLRFMNIAQGSLEECKYYIILSKDLLYINEDEFASLIASSEETSKLLIAYCKGIINNSGIKD